MGRLRASLPTVVKKYMWELKYGLLGYPQFIAPGDFVQFLSTRLSAISSVLDLGCGRGSLLRALRSAEWSGNYCGVDISRRAVDEARGILDQRSSWVASDFESFRSPFHWDLIAMVESLYYVKLSELPSFLERMMEMLSENGILVFRVHEFEKHREYVEGAMRLYPHLERVGENLYFISSRPLRTSLQEGKSIRSTTV
jgi:predicted TPR repeat methyltransferase